MDLSRGHFYKTIEEAKTDIKQYSKVHYFIRFVFVGNRPRRIQFYLIVGNFVPDEYKKIYSSGFVLNE